MAGNFHFAPGKSFQQSHVHGKQHLTNPTKSKLSGLWHRPCLAYFRKGWKNDKSFKIQLMCQYPSDQKVWFVCMSFSLCQMLCWDLFRFTVTAFVFSYKIQNVFTFSAFFFTAVDHSMILSVCYFNSSSALYRAVIRDSEFQNEQCLLSALSFRTQECI